MIRAFRKVILFSLVFAGFPPASALAQHQVDRWVFPQAVVGQFGSNGYRIELRLANTRGAAWRGVLRFLEATALEPMQGLEINGEAVMNAGAFPVRLEPKGSVFLRVHSDAESGVRGILVIEGAGPENPSGQVAPSFYYRLTRADGVTTDLIPVPPVSPYREVTGLVVWTRRSEGGRENFQVGVAAVAEADISGMGGTSSRDEDLTLRLHLNGAAGPLEAGLDLAGGQRAVLLDQLFPGLPAILRANPSLLESALLELASKVGPVYAALIGFGEAPDFEDIQHGVTPFGEVGNLAPVAVDDEFTVENDQIDVSLDVLANDSDPDSDDLLVTGVRGPSSGGFAAPAADGLSVIHTPASGFEGLETFTYEVSDGTSTDMATVTVQVIAPRVNQPPQVDAGPDRRVILRDSAPDLLLDGTVTDDGLPPGSTLQIEWSLISGPGLVVFLTPFQEDTEVDFPLAGVYVLELMANDGLYAASDRVVVTIDPAP